MSLSTELEADGDGLAESQSPKAGEFRAESEETCTETGPTADLVTWKLSIEIISGH